MRNKIVRKNIFEIKKNIKSLKSKLDVDIGFLLNNVIIRVEKKRIYNLMRNKIVRKNIFEIKKNIKSLKSKLDVDIGFLLNNVIIRVEKKRIYI